MISQMLHGLQIPRLWIWKDDSAVVPRSPPAFVCSNLKWQSLGEAWEWARDMYYQNAY